MGEKGRDMAMLKLGRVREKRLGAEGLPSFCPKLEWRRG
jgi:hypothetical protein